jgi:hypothetical protein
MTTASKAIAASHTEKRPRSFSRLARFGDRGYVKSLFIELVQSRRAFHLRMSGLCLSDGPDLISRASVLCKATPFPLPA